MAAAARETLLEGTHRSPRDPESSGDADQGRDERARA